MRVNLLRECAMQWIFPAALAIAGVGISAFDASPTRAAVLTVGQGVGPPYGGGVCADVTGGNLASGTPVQAYDCNIGPNQQFEFTGSTIRALGGQRCLGVQTTGVNDVDINSYTCNGTAAQQFYYSAGVDIICCQATTGQIVVVGALFGVTNGPQCLDAENMANGTQLIASNCDSTKNSQQWQIKGAILTVGAGFGQPYGSDVCADVASGKLASGTPVQAYSCSAGPNQQFELYGSTIYALGGQRCMTVQGSGIAPGTPVVSSVCNGSAQQQFYYLAGVANYSGQIIFNLNLYGYANRCLDAGNLADGTQLVINECNGSNSQVWQIK